MSAIFHQLSYLMQAELIIKPSPSFKGTESNTINEMIPYLNHCLRRDSFRLMRWYHTSTATYTVIH